MNEITINLHKQNSISINNKVPTILNTKKTIAYLQNVDFTMIRFHFDNYCYADANETLRQKEYNRFVNRINKIAQELGLTVATIENQIISGVEFENKFVAVALRVREKHDHNKYKLSNSNL